MLFRSRDEKQRHLEVLSKLRRPETKTRYDNTFWYLLGEGQEEGEAGGISGWKSRAVIALQENRETDTATSTL